MQPLADLLSYDLSLVEVDKKDSILKEYEVSPVGSPMWRKWLPANFQKDRKCLLVALSRHANELRKEPGYWIGRHRRTPKSDSNDPKRPSVNWRALSMLRSFHVDGIRRMQHVFLCLKEQSWEYSDRINNPKGGLK